MRHLLFIMMLTSVANAKNKISISFSPEKWELLKYSKIRPNVVKFEPKKMIINVNNSASPLIYKLSDPLLVSNILINAKIIGKIKLNGVQQGEKGADDFLLRVGLVYEGEEKLGYFRQMMAPSWVVKLFNLAPSGIGISRIRFFNVFSDKNLINKERVHPQSELITEKFVIQEPLDGNLNIAIPVSSQKKVLALWISCDGDDTTSHFSIEIKDLELKFL